MAKKKKGGNSANKARFKKVSAFCRKVTKPFTKPFGRCFKVNMKNAKAGKRIKRPNDVLLTHLRAQVLGAAQTISRYGMEARANTDIFPDKKSRFRPKLESGLMRAQIRVSFSGTAPKVRVRTYVDEDERDSEVLNNDDLVTNVSRSFDFQVRKEFTYGIVLTQNGTVEELLLDEVPISA